jgi:3-methylcrotonyl-CoA carboxylase alpha subunit
VSHYYDPMLAKLIVSGSDRSAAIARLERALLDFRVDGVRTNLPLLLWIARDDAFRAGETTTSFLDQRFDASFFSAVAVPREAVLLCAAALLVDGRAPWRIGEIGVPLRLQHGESVVEIVADALGALGAWRLSGAYSVELHAQRRGERVQAGFDGTAISGAVTYAGDAFDVHLDGRTWCFSFASPPSVKSAEHSHGGVAGALVAAPMPGKIVKVAVREGDEVEEHALLIVLEAMKMEHRIEATAAASVKSVLVKEGQIVSSGTTLVELA